MGEWLGVHVRERMGEGVGERDLGVYEASLSAEEEEGETRDMLLTESGLVGVS